MEKHGCQEQRTTEIRERTIQIRLSDDDVARISEKAASVGLTVSELLGNFIEDLTDGAHSNGSDERMLANEWLERCGFMREQTFLAFLIDQGELQPYLDSLDYIAELEGDLREAAEQEEREAIQEDIDREREITENCYTEYSEQIKEPQPKEDALKGVKDYKARLEKLKGES